MRRRAILDRRRIEARRGGLPDYVSDGLIHWYDPLSITDPSDPVWYDMVRDNPMDTYLLERNADNALFSYTWTPRGKEQVAGDAGTHIAKQVISGGGNNPQWLRDNFLSKEVDYSVEVVFTRADLGGYVTHAVTGQHPLRMGGSGVGAIRWGAGTTRVNFDSEVTQDSDPHSMSLSRGYPNASVFADGVWRQTTPHDPFFASSFLIGADSVTLNDGRWFRGTIHNIRIYDRALTAGEVAHNWAIDKRRFDA